MSKPLDAVLPVAASVGGAIECEPAKEANACAGCGRAFAQAGLLSALPPSQRVAAAAPLPASGAVGVGRAGGGAAAACGATAGLSRRNDSGRFRRSTSGDTGRHAVCRLGVSLRDAKAVDVLLSRLGTLARDLRTGSRASGGFAGRAFAGLKDSGSPACNAFETCCESAFGLANIASGGCGDSGEGFVCGAAAASASGEGPGSEGALASCGCATATSGAGSAGAIGLLGVPAAGRSGVAGDGSGIASGLAAATTSSTEGLGTTCAKISLGVGAESRSTMRLHCRTSTVANNSTMVRRNNSNNRFFARVEDAEEGIGTGIGESGAMWAALSARAALAG